MSSSLSVSPPPPPVCHFLSWVYCFGPKLDWKNIYKYWDYKEAHLPLPPPSSCKFPTESFFRASGQFCKYRAITLWTFLFTWIGIRAIKLQCEQPCIVMKTAEPKSSSSERSRLCFCKESMGDASSTPSTTFQLSIFCFSVDYVWLWHDMLQSWTTLLGEGTGGVGSLSHTWNVWYLESSLSPRVVIS